MISNHLQSWEHLCGDFRGVRWREKTVWWTLHQLQRGSSTTSWVEPICRHQPWPWAHPVQKIGNWILL